MKGGRQSGAGTFAEGKLVLHGDSYDLLATSSEGIRFRVDVTSVMFELSDISPGTINQVNSLDLSGLDFRLTSTGHLDLRRA